MIRAEFQPGEVVAFRLFGAEVQGEICAILGPRASVQLAVLTVIAYYFERCDIYEEPRNHAS